VIGTGRKRWQSLRAALRASVLAPLRGLWHMASELPSWMLGRCRTNSQMVSDGSITSAGRARLLTSRQLSVSSSNTIDAMSHLEMRFVKQDWLYVQILAHQPS
jgi:hypothetical protein